jgi:hypothetical protein
MGLVCVTLLHITSFGFTWHIGYSQSHLIMPASLAPWNNARSRTLGSSMSLGILKPWVTCLAYPILILTKVPLVEMKLYNDDCISEDYNIRPWQLATKIFSVAMITVTSTLLNVCGSTPYQKGVILQPIMFKVLLILSVTNFNSSLPLSSCSLGYSSYHSCWCHHMIYSKSLLNISTYTYLRC